MTNFFILASWNGVCSPLPFNFFHFHKCKKNPLKIYLKAEELRAFFSFSKLIVRKNYFYNKSCWNAKWIFTLTVCFRLLFYLYFKVHENEILQRVVYNTTSLEFFLKANAYIPKPNFTHTKNIYLFKVKFVNCFFAFQTNRNFSNVLKLWLLKKFYCLFGWVKTPCKTFKSWNLFLLIPII